MNLRPKKSINYNEVFLGRKARLSIERDKRISKKPSRRFKNILNDLNFLLLSGLKKGKTIYIGSLTIDNSFRHYLTENYNTTKRFKEVVSFIKDFNLVNEIYEENGVKHWIEKLELKFNNKSIIKYNSANNRQQFFHKKYAIDSKNRQTKRG